MTNIFYSSKVESIRVINDRYSSYFITYDRAITTETKVIIVDPK